MRKELHSVTKGRQLSIFLDDKPGSLSAITSFLGQNGINIYALSLAEGLGHSYVRLVVDKHDQARQLVEDAGELAMEREILLLELANTPGSLGKVTHELGAAGVNIEYAYCAGGPNVDQGLVIVRTEDVDKALAVLQKLMQ